MPPPALRASWVQAQKGWVTWGSSWGADSQSIIARALLATKGSASKSLWSRDGVGHWGSRGCAKPSPCPYQSWRRGTIEHILFSWGSAKLATWNEYWIHRAVELSRDSDPWTASSVKQMCSLKWEPRKKVTGKLRTCYKTHLQKAIIITIVSPKRYLQTSFCTIPALWTALI